MRPVSTVALLLATSVASPALATAPDAVVIHRRAVVIDAHAASLDDYIDSIDYAVKRIGIDHVCLSTDFNHGFAAVKGWHDEGETPDVTAALLRRGYSEQAIDKLWGANLLRVLAAAEKVKAP